MVLRKLSHSLKCEFYTSVGGVIEKFVSFSDTENSTELGILSKFCDVHIGVKFISSN